MKRMIVRKLRGRSGESIAETLIALLISAAALLMLAGAISSAAHMIGESNTAMKKHYSSFATSDAGWYIEMRAAVSGD